MSSRSRVRRLVRWHMPLTTMAVAAATLAGLASPASSSPTRPTETTTTSALAAPAATAAGVPAGFSPVSVSFVSAKTGWVLGTVPAGSGVDLTVAHTTDGGTTWSRSAAPDVTVDDADRGAAVIRFANPANGWIMAPVTTTHARPPLTTLWSTHDGGAGWHRVAVPGGGHVTALGASGGAFQLAELATIGSAAPVVRLYSAAATSNSWIRSATSLLIGAGPVASAQLTLLGKRGWAVEVDRTVIAGARLTSGTWAPWTPPCRDALGAAWLAASSAANLVALCEEGGWGPPPAGITTGPWLFASSDGGDTFVAVGAIPKPEAGDADYSVAVPPGAPQVVVVGGSGLAATFDGGRTWRTVYSAPTGQVRFIAFATATQGAAIVTRGTSASTLLMTRDGGAIWSPARL